MGVIVASALIAVILMFTGIIARKSKVVRMVAVAGMVVLLGIAFYDLQISSAEGLKRFNNMLVFNTYGAWFNFLIIACGLMYFLLFNKQIADVGKNDAEYFALMFFIMTGIFMLSAYNHLLILFLGIEILSIPQYILAGSDKENLKSNEASLKYFLMGAFSTGILLMGITLIYGSAGSFDIQSISQVLQDDLSALPIIGVLMILIAFGFKVSAAPMHWWTADVYDGTPTAITPYMATIVKVGAFVGFIRLFHFAFGSFSASWSTALAAIIVVTLLIGNVTAVYQQSVKRMMAYSSIAQAGFMLFAVYAVNDIAEKSIIYYAVAYTLASLGVFAAIIRRDDYSFDGFKGLGKSNPVLAGTTTVCLLSLAGIPITSGFFAKYFVLRAAMEAGTPIWLIVFAVLMAAISVYYYFRVIRAMYFEDGPDESVEPLSSTEKLFLVVNAAIVVLAGCFPSLILH